MSSVLLKLLAAALVLPTATAVAPRVRDAHAAAQEGRAQDCGLPTHSRKFDEYGALTAEEEKARLDKLAAALDAEPDDTKAFIIGYAGRGGRAGEGLARADRARKVITDKSQTTFLYNTRLNTLDCGRREAPATEIWLTPAGASPPRCAPTLDPAPAPAGGASRRPARRRGGRL